MRDLSPCLHSLSVARPYMWLPSSGLLLMGFLVHSFQIVKGNFFWVCLIEALKYHLRTARYQVKGAPHHAGPRYQTDCEFLYHKSYSTAVYFATFWLCFVNQVLSFPFHEGYVAGIFKLALYKNVSVFIGWFVIVEGRRKQKWGWSVDLHFFVCQLNKSGMVPRSSMPVIRFMAASICKYLVDEWINLSCVRSSLCLVGELSGI